MPDAVLNFARTKAAAGTSWSGASPVEEYTLTYSTGTDGQEVTLEVAQWSQGEDAQSQYDNLTTSVKMVWLRFPYEKAMSLLK